jgi:acyl carrier protein
LPAPAAARGLGTAEGAFLGLSRLFSAYLSFFRGFFRGYPQNRHIHSVLANAKTRARPPGGMKPPGHPPGPARPGGAPKGPAQPTKECPMSDILERVTNVVVEQLAIEPSVVVPEASFQDDLGADSLDLVELIMAMEDEFDIKIDDEAVQNIKTVKDVVSFIQENQ